MNVSIFILVALHLISGLTLISEATSITNYGRGKYPPLCLFKLCNLAPRKSDFDLIIGGYTDYDDSNAVFDDYNVFGRPTRNFVINIVYFVINQNKVPSDNKAIKSDEVTESTLITESTSVTEEEQAIGIKEDNEARNHLEDPHQFQNQHKHKL